MAEATGLALPLHCVLLWTGGMALGLAPGIPSLVQWL